MEEKTLRYKHENGEITVLWRPKLCIHAGVCVRTLPEVYHPKDKPWVLPNNASTEALIRQIKACPSGALGYELFNVNEEE